MLQVALLQSRMVKRKKKLRRIRTMDDDDDRPAPNKNKQTNKRKKQTNFASEFTDTSKASAKRLRYDANRVQKGLPLQNGKGKPTKGKPKGKGKTFGKPQAPKQGARKKNK